LDLPIKISHANSSGSTAASKKPRRQTSQTTKTLNTQPGPSTSRTKIASHVQNEEPIGLYQDDDPLQVPHDDDDIVEVTETPKNFRWPPLRSSTRKHVSTTCDEDIVEISDDDQNDDCAILKAKLKTVRNAVGNSLRHVEFAIHVLY
jgi:hypothetical protein